MNRGFWRSGDPLVWTAAGALALCLIMLFGLVGLVAFRGLAYFWPAELVQLELADGSLVVGQVTGRERIPAPGGTGAAARGRIQLKVGNRDVYGLDFRWIEEDLITGWSTPPELAVVERLEQGDAYGVPVRLLQDGEVAAQGDEILERLPAMLAEAAALRRELRRLERDVVGDINRRIEAARLALVRLERQAGGGAASLQGVDPHQEAAARGQEAAGRHREAIARAQAQYEQVLQEIAALRRQLSGRTLVLALAGGSELSVDVASIVRIYRPNAMSPGEKLGFYAAKLWEFLSSEPRESNTEGGIFPALFGTVLLVLIMTVAVVPIGVLAAVYLKEYARDGWFTRALWIAIRNLAGVPSIVFGIFGLGFFIYGVGGSIDRAFFPERLPAPTFGTGGILWASLTLALLTLPVVIVATEEGLAAVPRAAREASYALGATRFETVWKVVVPGAMPGILTGVILGIARATGEVAPLMMTGVVKLASELPVDGLFPFIHLERKFMHLGFFIYDLGFQSPNVEAARPMLFATAFTLLAVVLVLNGAGIGLRNRIRARIEKAGPG